MYEVAVVMQDGSSIKNRMQGIDEDTFDTFFQGVLWWYSDVSRHSSDPPNLYDLVEGGGDTRHNEFILDFFVYSFALEMFEREPDDGDYEATYHIISNNYGTFVETVLHDVSLVFRFCNLHFIYSNYYDTDGVEKLIIENSALQEVW